MKIDLELDLTDNIEIFHRNELNDQAKIRMCDVFEQHQYIGIRKHENGVSFPKHTHDFIEIVCMMKGKSTHFINGEKIELNSGDILIINEDVEHEVKRTNESSEIYNILVKREFMNKIVYDNAIEKSFSESVYYILNNRMNYLIVNPKQAEISSIAHIIKQMIINVAEHSPLGNIKLKSNFNIFLCYLISCNNFTIPEDFQVDTEFMIRVRSYINNSKAPSLNELSSILKYSNSYVSKKVKALYGRNFIDVVQEQRMEKAAMLLINTDDSIEKIARECGYENITFFKTLFKRKQVYSPRVFREMNR